MDKIPAWVSGGVTLDGSARKWYRAVETLRKANLDRKAQGQPEVPFSEDDAKALYIKYGGLVLETEEPVVDDEPSEEAKEPKKKAKKAE